MPLIDDVRSILKGLRDKGWADLLGQHGLDLAAADLAAELDRPLPGIRRDVPGFRDFAPDGTRGIEPGDPARSLLYHALASPLVHPGGPGGLPGPDAYPTLEDLDIIENYVYARAGRSLADFPEAAVVAVFAHQYRSGTRSPHGLFADVAYSRTGVARVGTAAANYDPARRSFWPVPPGGGDAMAVMPARYSAFLAVARRPRPGDVVLQDEDIDDRTRTFFFPVHKLFPGGECLAGLTLTLEFAERHLNEKLRRLHADGDLQAVEGFNTDAAPFVRDSSADGGLVALSTARAFTLVVPVASKALARTATQKNAKTRRKELVRFIVPRETADNRFWTSYQTPVRGPDETPTRIGRQAPGYVNIRHRVSPDSPLAAEDLNDTIADEKKFLATLAAGKYEAAHFIDDTCDGCVVARAGGLLSARPNLAAFSLVTAPDFFPLIDQVAISDWVRRRLADKMEQFSQGEPWPLCDGRVPANPAVQLPPGFGTGPAFRRDDESVVAVVGHLRSTAVRPSVTPLAEDTSVSCLPDAASNEFAPGWDVTRAADDRGQFYATFGLGSPFPEDSKLCAALNSFWPAAAPDASRTFGVVFSPTAMPLMDSELGYHPDHPRVRAGEVTSARGWDGEFGPFLETVGGKQVVNCSSQNRSDYTGNAAAGLVRLSGLAAITASEMIARMEALRSCIHALPPTSPPPVFVSTTKHFLVTAEPVADWAVRPDRGDTRLMGKGYLYMFVQLVNPGKPTPTAGRRWRLAVVSGSLIAAQVTAVAVCWRQGNGPFHFVAAL